MARGMNGAVIRQFEQLFRHGTTAGLDDGQLLDRFASRRDEAAFAALVTRHGPMVLGVCRRLLRDPNDVDDAFQATFLILARRAGSIGRPHLLGNWLHGVARRVALRARSQAARRHRREQPSETAIDGAIARDPLPESADRLDLRAVIDEELSRLPESQRRPIVLCHLEGLTHEEAAARLSWPVGTVRSRMARGRERLRLRLASRGVAPAALGATATWPELAPAAVPPALVDATVRAAITFAATSHLAAVGALSAGAATLARGAMNAMILGKLKVVAAVGLMSVGLAGGGVAVVAQQGDHPGGAGTHVEQPSGGSIESLIDRRDRLEAEMERLRDQQTVLIEEMQTVERELESLRGDTETTAPMPTPEATLPPDPAMSQAEPRVMQGRVDNYELPDRLVFTPFDPDFGPNPGDEVFVYQPKWEIMTLPGPGRGPGVAMRRPDHNILARARVDRVESGKALCTVTHLFDTKEDLRRGLEVVRISDLATYRDGQFLIPDMGSIPGSAGAAEETRPTTPAAEDNPGSPTLPEPEPALNPLYRDHPGYQVQQLSQRLDDLEAQLKALQQPNSAPTLGGGFAGGLGGGFTGMGGLGGLGMGGLTRGGDQPGQIPYIQGESIIVVQPEGQDRVLAYSLAKGEWYPQDLPESQHGKRVVPIVGESLAAFTAGTHVFAFSGSAGQWDGIELPEEGAQPVVSRQTVLVEHAGRLHVFSAETGTWSQLPLGTSPTTDEPEPAAIAEEEPALGPAEAAPTTEDGQAVLQRWGQYVFAQPPSRGRITVVNLGTNQRDTYVPPEGTRVSPTTGGEPIALRFSGEQIREIAVYDPTKDRWTVQALREPASESLAPAIEEHGSVVYLVGRDVYWLKPRYEVSQGMGRLATFEWEVRELDGPPEIETSPTPAELTLREGNRLHILHLQMGTWTSIDPQSIASPDDSPATNDQPSDPAAETPPTGEPTVGEAK